MFNNHSGHSPKPPRPYADVSGQGGFWSNMSYQNNNFYEDLPLGFEGLQADEYFEDLETPGYMEDLDYSSIDYPGFSENDYEEADYSGGMDPFGQMSNAFSNQGYSDFGMPGGGGYGGDYYNQSYMPPMSYQGPPSWMSGFYNYSANNKQPKNPARDGSFLQSIAQNAMQSNNNPQNESAPSMGEEVSPFFQAPNPTPNPNLTISPVQSTTTSNLPNPTIVPQNQVSQINAPQATGGITSLGPSGPITGYGGQLPIGGIPLSQMGASYNK